MTSSNTTISGGGTVSQQLLNTVNGTPSSSSPTSASNSAASLQQTFLQLFVAQLQNQDPTNPMDSSQMTSQLAQINTVTGINQLNTTVASLSAQLSASQTTQSALLLGQSVLVPGTTATVSNGASPGFGVSLASAVSDLTVTIKDQNGAVVSTLDLGPQSAGTVPVGWKPTDASGKALPDGTYTISALGMNAGSSAAETTLTGAQVVGVVPQSGGTTSLLLNNGTTVASTSVAAVL